MAYTEEFFGAMMKEMVQTEGQKLLEAEKSWKDAVPEKVDIAALSALSGTAAPLKAAPAAAKTAASGGAALRVVRIAAAALGAAVVIAAGSYAVSPAVRQAVAGLVTGGGAVPAAVSVSGTQRLPGEYVIPDPGEGFALTETVKEERLACKWFTSDRQELMVQIAYKLPASISGADGAELLQVRGTLWGELLEQGEQTLLELKDGAVSVQIAFFNAERDEVLAYATLFAEENGLG